MHYEFTPGAQRALEKASEWTTSAEYKELLGLPEVLLGLLDEPECRAAQMLARHRVESKDICARWNTCAAGDNEARNRSQRWSHDLRAAFHAAEERLFAHPQPLTLATEHLLLGIVASGSEVGRWLGEYGLLPNAVEAEVHQLAGVDMSPLDWEDEEVLIGPEGPRVQNLLRSDAASKSDLYSHERSTEEFSEPLGTLSEIAHLRILDAAANRASEGLRVAEDYVRFALDDQHLMTVAKSLRHELMGALTGIRNSDLLAAREVQADVGCDVKHDAEAVRTDLAAVVGANFARLQQALRSLEEYSKVKTPEISRRFESLRYRAYTLQRAVDITRRSLEGLASARLYVLIDGRASEEEFNLRVKSLIAAGVQMIQLRDKQLDDRTLLSRARRLRDITRGTSVLIVINDRPDIAALTDADGVHVGQTEMTVKDARSVVGARRFVGVSTHSIEQARQAVLEGANYIGVGPTFPSTTKQFEIFPGLEFVRQVAAEIRLPAFAIGGITGSNVAEVLAAGLTRVAVAGSIASVIDPAAEVRKLLARLEKR